MHTPQLQQQPTLGVPLRRKRKPSINIEEFNRKAREANEVKAVEGGELEGALKGDAVVGQESPAAETIDPAAEELAAGPVEVAKVVLGGQFVTPEPETTHTNGKRKYTRRS